MVYRLDLPYSSTSPLYHLYITSGSPTDPSPEVGARMAHKPWSLIRKSRNTQKAWHLKSNVCMWLQNTTSQKEILQEHGCHRKQKTSKGKSHRKNGTAKAIWNFIRKSYETTGQQTTTESNEETSSRGPQERHLTRQSFNCLQQYEIA
jgi:hypothetical protein